MTAPTVAAGDHGARHVPGGADQLTAFVPMGPSSPDPTLYPAWLDTSVKPPVLRYWSGTAWTAVP